MKKSRAFSLIELSIVILIIGILVAGVTQGSRVVAQMKLSTARSLTRGSDVNGISDICLWLDVTAEGMLSNASGSTNVGDGDTVSAWADQNPQKTARYSFAQGTNAMRPIYKANGINGLPTLYFDATNNADGKALLPSSSFVFLTSEVTVFIVMRPIEAPVEEGYLIDSYAETGGERFLIGISSDAKTHLYASGSDVLDLAAVALNNNYITSAVATSTTSSIYRNGVLQESGAGLHSAFTADNFSIGSVYVGESGNFDGYISEFIMFSRALKTAERQSVEKYLGQKYGVKIS
jgi:prepilin-type N-terminal cleavage/methylation domain-containing protein